MKSIFSIFFLLTCVCQSVAQGEANIWYFGHNAGLDFNSGIPVALNNGQLNTYEGCSSFSDGNGNLLFYSDGTTVWNRNHTPMVNGTNLAGDASSTQSAMIIPKPNSSSEYYIFTVGAQSSENAGFNYYTIDMTAAGGFGAIVAGPIDLTQERLAALWTEKVAAVQGGDCDSYWVLSYIQNEFFAYRVSSSGVASTPVRSVIPFFATDPRGYLKISPDGTKIAIAHMSNSNILLYDFDDNTGVVSNERNLFLPFLPEQPSFYQSNQAYGVEFSPNSQLLYVHASNGAAWNDNNPTSHFSTLTQYDVTLSSAIDISNSAIVIDQQNMYRGALQLGPDHKIYRSISQSYEIGMPFLGVIDQPNERGELANYIHNGVNLGGQTSSQGLPPFIASIFSNVELTAEISDTGEIQLINDQNFQLCIGESVSITSEMITGSSTYEWFKNGQSFSTDPNIDLNNVSPSDNGNYLLVVNNVDDCGNINTLEGQFTLVVENIPYAGAPEDIIECDEDNDSLFSFDLSQNDALIIDGQSDVEVLYFLSMEDAENIENALPRPYEFEGGTVYARVQHIRSNRCHSITSFETFVYSAALPTESMDMTPLVSCDNSSIGSFSDGFIISDITSKATEILNGQNPTEFVLTYFTDDLYANQIINPSAFQNTIAGGQTIYVQVTNALNTDCFAQTSFDLNIYEQPIANIAPAMILCDDDNDGSMTFDLISQNDFINTTSGMTITYHTSILEAESGENGITSFTGSNGTLIYARVENELFAGCYDISEFELLLYDSPFPLDSSSITRIESCDNTSYGSDTDGIILFDLTQKESEILNGQDPTKFNITYYTDSGYIDQIINPQNYANSAFVGGQTIYVRMSNSLESTCFSDTSFEISIFELPNVLDNYTYKNCDEDGTPDGFTDFNLEQVNEFITLGDSSLNVTYHLSMSDADSGASNIDPPSPFNNSIQNIIYARIENNNGCHRVSTIELEVSTTSFPVNYNFTLEMCDDDAVDDAMTTFDLSQATADILNQFPPGQPLSIHYYRNLSDAQTEVNEITNISAFEIEQPNQQELYVRVESDANGDCFGLGSHVTLIVYPKPSFDVIPEAIVCLNTPPVTLETVNAQGNYNYQWINEAGTIVSNAPTAEVYSEGVYEVIASYTSSAGVCYSDPRYVTVSKSNIATISSEDITVVDDSENNSITIDTTNLGEGDYEFAIDNGNGGIGFFQEDPFFENISPGVRTVYVQDKNGCGMVSIEVPVIGFPSFFTPNNDGHNDIWQIKGVTSNFFSSSQVYIFDRYGKLLATINPQTGWDGFYNGEALPSSDYWFTATLTEQNGTVRVRKGNFSLIRR
ncbi:hypothetical protein KH5_23110 [Urechidicola sp. KH5]